MTLRLRKDTLVSLFVSFLIGLMWAIGCPSKVNARDNAKTAVPHETIEDVEGLFDMDLEELGDIQVTSASKEEEPIRESPSTISVYTEKEFEALGVRTLAELLMLVPGFDVRPTNQIDVRGISSVFNNRVLLMLDGIPMDDAYYGATGKTVNLIYLDYVERVEIIRGPGSTLYGTNAFAGIISVTTKRCNFEAGIPMVVVSSGLGTSRASSGTVTVGRKSGDVTLSGYVDYRRQTGPTYELKTSDLGRPGSVERKTRDISAGLRIGYSKYATLNVNYLRRENDGLLSLDNTLMPDSGYTTNWLGSSLDLFYAKNELELKGKVYGAWDRWSDVDLMVVVPNIDELFLDGLYEHPTLEMWRVGLDVYGRYTYKPHSFMLGGLFEHMRVPELPLEAPTNGRTGPSVGPDDMLMMSRMRSIVGVYLQYRWEMMDGLKLTLGGRWDYYDDFGSSVNPRAALVYLPSGKIYGKLIFGMAYRVPAFRECCANPNQYMVSNPKLTPERIYTGEVVLGMRPLSILNFQVSAYQNRISDIISNSPLMSGSRIVFENATNLHTYGIETEVSIELIRNLIITANYTYVSGWREIDGIFSSIPYITEHIGNLIVTADVLNHLQIAPYLEIRGARNRDSASGDTRAELKPYFLLNAHLRVYDIVTKDLSFSILFKNITNATYYGPSAYPGRNSWTVSGDIPAPGFEVFGTIQYGFL